MADQDEVIVLGNYPGVGGGPFVISNLGFTITDVMPGTNAPARGTAAVELTKHPGKLPTGPASGGSSRHVKRKHIPSSYTVKKGDTLSGIALKILGDASRWRQIARINKLRDPRKLKVGTKLKMPKS
jgi:nucleoid-associated protein YgaU